MPVAAFKDLRMDAADGLTRAPFRSTALDAPPVGRGHCRYGCRY